ncbi:MAG: cbb3-type cytochrome c oxidase subunit I [Bacteroidia bacterium]
MKQTMNPTSRWFFMAALIMLLLGLFFGVMAAHSYILPGFWNDVLGFIKLRPLHVSSVLFWILLGGTGCIYAALDYLAPGRVSVKMAKLQFAIWIGSIAIILWSYLNGSYGGREYWEFNPVYALPIALAWLLFLANFIRAVRLLKNWPVYVWMWMTGILFFLFTFAENYLWVIPYFREHFITDTTIQWKANGSLVGSWNQILYGTAFFLMDRITQTKEIGSNKTAFAMFFLGLFNLMFNWGHHIYTLPTEVYVKYIGYAVSMTEWIFFIKIIYTWKQSVTVMQRHYHYFPYRFLMASDIWVFINITQAVLMSIPALNLYTHGTHVTVAHAMGTTIGINSMILLAACFEFLGNKHTASQKGYKLLNISFWVTQIALLVFWLSLNGMGVLRGIWQMSEKQAPFSLMMDGMQPWFMVFVYSGSVMMLSMGTIVIMLLRSGFRKPVSIATPVPDSGIKQVSTKE